MINLISPNRRRRLTYIRHASIMTKIAVCLVMFALGLAMVLGRDGRTVDYVVSSMGISVESVGAVFIVCSVVMGVLIPFMITKPMNPFHPIIISVMAAPLWVFCAAMTIGGIITENSVGIFTALIFMSMAIFATLSIHLSVTTAILVYEEVEEEKN